MNFGLKALACLLLYPDAALKDNLPEIKEGRRRIEPFRRSERQTIYFY